MCSSLALINYGIMTLGPALDHLNPHLPTVRSCIHSSDVKISWQGKGAAPGDGAPFN